MREKTPASSRIWKYIWPDLCTQCWLWIGSCKDTGYGQIHQYGKPRPAHRVVYEAVKGDIPEGMQLDHLCRVRHCVNPDHLEPVTNQENARRGDCGKVTGAQNRAKTHCPRGHEYNKKNTYVDKAGSRCCRACWREKSQERRDAA